MPERVMVVGLDGADWRVLRPLMEAGVMPNLQRLVEQGASGPLESSVPTQSNTAWVTFMTGVNPGKHGVYSFMERAPGDPTRLVGVNSRSIRRETLFHVLSRQGYRVGAVNVPVTYPPFPVNGFLLSGMFVPSEGTYTYPRELKGELDGAVGGFPVNRIRWRYMPGQYEALLAEAVEVNAQRARALAYLVDHKPWDVFVQVFVSPDRVQHAAMHLIDPSHPRYREDEAARFRAAIHRFYRSLDDVVGLAVERAERHGLTLIVLSDHGFQPCDRQLRVEDLLVERGFLRYDRQQQVARRVRRALRRLRGGPAHRRAPAAGRPIGVGVDWSRTRAYVALSTEQGISINLAGREPRGIVGPDGDYERTAEELRAALRGWRDPATGQPLVQDVWLRDELYHGPLASAAPDVVYAAAPGLSVGNEQKRNLAPLAWRTGEHDRYGILVAYGPAVRAGTTVEGARLMDLAPTILYLAGAALPADLDGRVLEGLLRPEVVGSRPVEVESAPVAFEPEAQSYSDEEEAAVLDQLRGLGYV